MSDIVVHEQSSSVFAIIDERLNVESDVLDADSYGQETWLIKCGDSLTDLGVLGEKVTTYEDRILYRVNKIWKNMRMESLKRWNYEFYEWAREYLVKVGAEPIANPTIDNRIRTYRDYLSSEAVITLPETVTITNVLPSGKPVIDVDTGEVCMVTVIPDLKDVKYSKMLTAAKVAKQEGMTQEAWNMLFDPTVKHRPFEKKIKEIDHTGLYDNQNKISRDFSFFMQKGIVYISSANRTAPLFTLADLDDSENVDLMLVGLDVILSPIGIQNPMSQEEYAK